MMAINEITIFADIKLGATFTKDDFPSKGEQSFEEFLNDIIRDKGYRIDIFCRYVLDHEINNIHGMVKKGTLPVLVKVGRT